MGAGDNVDECIKTISCEGNCSSNSKLSHSVPALEVGRGKNRKDMKNRIVANSLTVHSDGIEYVSECVQTVHCAGDCKKIQHTTTPESGAGGGARTSLEIKKLQKG